MTMVWLFAAIAVILIIIKSIPKTWAAFAALSAVLVFAETKITQPVFSWLLLAYAIWFIALIHVFFARFRTKKAVIAMAIMVIALVGIGAFAPKTSIAPEDQDVQPVVYVYDVDQIADYNFQEAGWVKGRDYTDKVDGSLDTSTPGSGAFTEKNIRNVPDMIAFLKAKSTKAVKAIDKIIIDTGANEEIILTPSNWRVYQSLGDFDYPSNTMLSNSGEVVDAGSKEGKAGDIFLIFVNPMNGKYKIFRGACANPQEIIPKPTPSTTPSTPTTTPEPVPVPKPVPKPKPVPEPKPKVLESKDIRQDIQSNPMVDDWKKDVPGSYGDDRTVSDEDGSKVANGYQEEPEEDAEQAEKEAYDSSKAAKEKQDTAVDNAVDNGAGTSNDDNFDDDAGDVGSGDNAIDW